MRSKGSIYPQITQINLCNLWILKFVDLRGQDEIALSQSVDLVRPDRDLRLSPSKANIRMVTLLFRQITDAIYKHLRFAKVRKTIALFEVMLVNNFPAVQLREESRDLFCLQRRHTPATWHTFFQ